MAASGRVIRRSQAGPISPGKSSAKKATTVRMKKRDGSDSQLTACLIVSIMSGAPSDRSRDAAVLADAPEMDGHQDRGDQGDADAVQDVEAQQRAGADEPAGQER